MLEYSLSHTLTPGKHNRSVIAALRQNGFGEIADWMEQHQAHEQNRPIADQTFEDHQQAKNTAWPVARVKGDLRAAYKGTDSGRAFQAALAEKGYYLARGDRRDFVIVDGAGGLHSPRRRLGVKASALRDRWSDVDLAQLPTVDQVQCLVDPDRPLKRALAKGDQREAIALMEKEREAIEQEIAALEEQSQERGQTAETQDQRPLIEVFEQYKDRERNKSLRRAIDTSTIVRSEFYRKRLEYRRRARKFEGIALAVLLSYTGKQAEQERDRRLSLVQNGDISQRDKRDPRPFKQYVRDFKTLIKEKGHAIYQRADRFLAEKLARRHWGKAAIRRALARASPQVMEERPGARTSYIRTVVDRAYGRVEQQHNQRATLTFACLAIMEKESQSKEGRMVGVPQILITALAWLRGGQTAKKGIDAAKKVADMARKAEQVAKQRQLEQVRAPQKQPLERQATQKVERAQEVTREVMKVSARGPKGPGPGGKQTRNAPLKNTEKGLMGDAVREKDKEQDKEKNATPNQASKSRNLTPEQREEVRSRTTEAIKTAQEAEAASKDRPLTHKEIYCAVLIMGNDKENIVNLKTDIKAVQTILEIEKNKTSLERLPDEMRQNLIQTVEQHSPTAACVEDPNAYANNVVSEAVKDLEQLQNQRPEQANFAVHDSLRESAAPSPYIPSDTGAGAER